MKSRASKSKKSARRPKKSARPAMLRVNEEMKEWAGLLEVVAGEYVPTTLKVPVIEEVNVAVHVAVPTGLVP